MAHENSNWYEIVNAAGGAGEMVLYGIIGPYDRIDDKAFIRDFAALAATSKTINLRLNSGGGSVFSGIPIYNAIKSSKVPVTITVEGMAASMASILLQAAGPGLRKMYKNARVMVHKPSGGAAGSATKMRQTADMLDSLEATLADIYVENTGQSETTVQGWLVEGVDRWFTAAEAKAAGLIDEIVDMAPKPVAAPKNALNEAEMFAHYQAALANPTTPTEPEVPINHHSNPIQPMNFALYNAALTGAGAVANLTAASTEQDVVAAFNEALNAANHKATQAAAKVTELTNQLTAANEEKVTALVAGAVAAGKILASQKGDFETLARANYASAANILHGMAGKPSATNLLVNETSTTDEVDPRAGWDFGKYRKEAPAVLEKMRVEEPKRYEELKNKYVTVLNTK